MKQCFVIMPYGGEDTDDKRRFLGVYQSIIVPAAAAAGYDCKRSDLASEPGNITHDIIRDLAESDIVIADLTTANANVFFELGIRHAFRKSGTVHIIDINADLAFDIRQYRALKYSTDLADIPEVIQGIKAAISRRESQPERPDNPVHDAIPQLPANITMAGDEALRDQLRAAQSGLEELHTKNETLSARLAELSPDGDGTGDDLTIDVDELLDRADEIMKSTGEHALLRLRQAMDTGGSDAFVKELRGVLRSPYLDQNDFMEIVILCRGLGLQEHRRATLEVARRRYPHSNEIFLAFMDALDDSPNPADNERGRLMLEDRMDVEHGPEGPKFMGKTSLSLKAAFGMLFNFYIHANKHEWILSLTDDTPDQMDGSALMLRNRARSLSKLGRSEEALEAYTQAMEIDPTDDQTLSWYADFLDDLGRFDEAYQLCEQAILADPTDGRLYTSLAVHILNRGYRRTASGSIEGPLPRKQRSQVALPVLLKGIEVGARQGTGIVQEVVRVLVRADAIPEAEAIAQGNIPNGTFDRAPVEFIEQMLQQQTDGEG